MAAMGRGDDRPDGARVTTDMIGSACEALPVTWDERDTMLYALGVGAGLGDPQRDLAFTTENSGGVTLQAVPSMVCVLTSRARPPALTLLDSGRFLHAEQRIDLHRPLPPNGQGVVRNEVEQVLDKGAGSGAILVNRATLHDKAGELLAEVRSSIFVRGAGGFDGQRGEQAQWTLPPGAPDARIVHHTREEQALLYRLSGDRHRLHSDPDFASHWGFDRPILHGLATYGFACRALVEGFADGNPTRLTGIDGRFRKPVYPGDTLTTEIWRRGDGAAVFHTLDGAGDPVLERGRATLAS